MIARLGRRRLLIAATASGLALLAGDARAMRATTWRWQGSALGAEFDDPAGSSRPCGCRAGDRRLPRGDHAARADLQPIPGRFCAVAAEPPGPAGSTAARTGRVAGLRRAGLRSDRRCLRRHRAAALGSLCRALRRPGRPSGRPERGGARGHPGPGGLAGGRARSDPDQLSPTRHGGDAQRRGARLHHRPRRRSPARPRIRERAGRAGRGQGTRPPPGLDPWRAGIADPNDSSAVLLELPLLDTALATSGGYGTWFDPAHRHHHLLDPATGRSAVQYAAVSVTTARAMVADALSTALTIMPAAAARRPLATFGPATAYLFARDGQQATVEP